MCNICKKILHIFCLQNLIIEAKSADITVSYEKVVANEVKQTRGKYGLSSY